MAGGEFMTTWQWIVSLGIFSVLAAIIGTFTFIVHIRQTRMLNEWKKEDTEVRKAEAEVHRAEAEAHRAHEETMRAITETQRYIADLIVKEGERTREAVYASR